MLAGPGQSGPADKIDRHKPNSDRDRFRFVAEGRRIDAGSAPGFD